MMRLGAILLVILLSACGEGPTGSRIAKVLPDSVVNVWVEIEVESPAPYHPDIVVEVAKQLYKIQSDIRAGKIKPGKDVTFVTAMVTTKSGTEKFDFGNLRFPIDDFLKARAGVDAPLPLLDSVDAAEPGTGPGFKAAHNFCADGDGRLVAPTFCSVVDLDQAEQ